MLELIETKGNNYSSIDVIGRLDTSTYSQLEDMINTIIDKGEHNIIVCLKNMEYVSSSGLRVFLMMLKKMNALGGNFYLCDLRPNVNEIFEIAGFSSIFKIFDHKEKAISNL